MHRCAPVIAAFLVASSMSLPCHRKPGGPTCCLEQEPYLKPSQKPPALISMTSNLLMTRTEALVFDLMQPAFQVVQCSLRRNIGYIRLLKNLCMAPPASSNSGRSICQWLQQLTAISCPADKSRYVAWTHHIKCVVHHCTRNTQQHAGNMQSHSSAAAALQLKVASNLTGITSVHPMAVEHNVQHLRIYHTLTA